MVPARAHVVWLHDIDKEDEHLVGGKSANLGEMLAAKFPVPPGFVVTSYAYRQFIKENKLELKINHLVNTIHFDNPDSLRQVCTHVKKLIASCPVPEAIVRDVFDYYKRLGGVFKNPLVAIRSSATGEDSKDASFAGQQETFLNVFGEASLIEYIRLAWASLFEPRAVYYRHTRKMDQTKAAIALVVQKMVESDVSGVMFTVDPLTGNKNRVIIEAVYGLGEYIVQGRVSPDHYEVDKSTIQIIDKKISNQDVMLKKVRGANKELKVTGRGKNLQKLADVDIAALANIGKKIENHYYFPQDIEWAKEGNRMYIVQTRPITTLQNEQKKTSGIESGARPILTGDPASPGIKSGYVKVLKSPREIGKVNNGDVLVAPYTNPDYVPAMKKASAIVTEKGGRTSHAAIVSREFGIPAVVGAARAMQILRDNMLVTVNGSKGEVYKGNVVTTSKSVEKHTEYKTKTHLMVNIAEPELAQSVSAMDIDGIGLLRAEFMIAGIGTHPKKMIEEKRSGEFVTALAQGIETICKHMFPRPVYYRATDFKTNEYRNLKGGKMFEPVESNPMLGYRGVYRYINDPKVFNLELEAIKLVREKRGLTNLQLMLPFVRTVRELLHVKKLISAQGLRRSPSFKLIMMAEIPANVFLIDEFLSAGIDGVSIGSNDLTMLILGIDRDNEEVAVEFDERNEAVLQAMEKLIKSCRKHKVTSSICGQAPSNFPDLVEKLTEWGIDSISVAPDAVEKTREIIYRAEQKLKKQ